MAPFGAILQAFGRLLQVTEGNNVKRLESKLINEPITNTRNSTLEVKHFCLLVSSVVGQTFGNYFIFYLRDSFVCLCVCSMVSHCVFVFHHVQLLPVWRFSQGTLTSKKHILNISGKYISIPVKQVSKPVKEEVSHTVILCLYIVSVPCLMGRLITTL